MSSTTRTKAIAKFSYTPQLGDELGLTKKEEITVVEKSTDGWWKGESVDGRQGWFPANYVEEVEEPKVQENFGILETIIGLYQFDASAPEELSFQQGERLEVIEHPESDPEWFKARNQQGGVGLVPRNYVEVINPSASSDTAPHSSNFATDPEPWLYGKISRDRAEELLNYGREGEFLVRDSESNPGDLSISVRGIDRNKHFKVQTTHEGMLKIGNRTFQDMRALITHYTANPIFASPTEQLFLSRPLPK